VDTLSHAPVGSPQAADLLLESGITAFVQSVIDGLPAAQGWLVEIKTMQQEDQVCSQVAYYCRNGWPADKSKMDPDICPFFTERDALTMQEGLLLYHTRLVISVELRKDILSKIHNDHQGIVKCRALAKCSVWWPGLSQWIQSMLGYCATCEKKRKARPEPLSSFLLTCGRKLEWTCSTGVISSSYWW